MTRSTNGLGRHDIVKTALLVLAVVNVIRDPSWIQWARNLSTIIAYKVAYEIGTPAEPTRVYDTVEMVLGVGAILVGLSLLFAALRVLRAIGRFGRSAKAAAGAAEAPDAKSEPAGRPRAQRPRATESRPAEPAATPPDRQPTVSAHAPMRDAWFPRFIVIAIVLFAAVSVLRWGLP